MLRNAFLAATISDGSAMLIAFDQDADHDSVNFAWFRRRFDRFVYVDRVITATAARRRGHARTLYEALFAKAQAAEQDRIVCEVNLDPPNPVSDRFHAGLGFMEVGRASLAGGKQVRYVSRRSG